MAQTRTERARGRAPERRTPTRVDGYAPIGDYAAIGDGRTLALVALDGAIDWLPLPTIDQGSAFGALLDAGKGGSFRLAPDGEASVERRYVERTNVLETTYTTATGTLRVTDALTLQDGGILPWVELARRVECTGGEVRVRWSVEPRFGYGSEDTELVEIGGVPVALGKRLRLAVHAWGLGTPHRSSSSVSGAIDMREGDTGLIACVAVDNEPVPHPPREEVETRFEGTCASWKRWLDGQSYDGPWADAVARSALALKLLIYAPSGAIAAAGTTGLPERIGGSRNYDYRFCWIRDATFTLDALTRLGYREQVHASLSWLLDVTTPTHPRLQPLYGLDGSVPRRIQKLDVHGYRGSQPVERGNSAATQLQLGNFGDLFETVWYYVRHGNVLDPSTATRLEESANFVCDVWRNRDSGLWELGDHRHYTISKLSCWTALRRAEQLALEGQLSRKGLDRWRETQGLIREFVETRCWSESKRSYTFYADTDDLDCAVLLAAHFEFDDPAGERMNGTIDALRRELSAGGPLLYRYTGMKGREGAFLACSFWMATALAKAGRLDEARALMDELVELGNDVGLYSEELDPTTRELLGNFPQALTHLSLVRAAITTSDMEKETSS